MPPDAEAAALPAPPAPTGFPVMQSVQNVPAAGVLTISITGSAKAVLDIRMAPAVPTPDPPVPIDWPPSATLSLLVHAARPLPAACNVSTSVSASATTVRIDTAGDAGIDGPQIAVAASLALPAALDTPLDLHVSMENGAVRIDPLTPAVAFGRVSVVTAVGAIDTNGLVAQSLLLRAGIGAIKAQANVSHDLFVDTGAGSVLADIRFLDDATAARRGSGASQDGDDAPRTAHISSSGGLIGGSVAGYRSLQVLGGTAPITLSLDPLHGAATSLDSMAGASRLEFAPGYNGRFNARTSLGRVSVVGHDVHFDPPGGGLPIPDRAASGYVGPLDTAKSSVLASATLGLITLTFA